MSAPLVLGTAGHVDHGKTALALALTGRDTDRLPAEKSRGISIELGFAPLELPSGRRLSLVDVPGHERFVRHMVAGASGVDGFLLCVAADDGVMPQTVEHMAVLGLLGVHEGVVAVTKADLMDPALAAEEARELVGPGPAIVPVVAPRGEGLPALRAALGDLAARLERRTAAGGARLWVDRAFSVPGAGTVVTGTLWGSPIAVGEQVRVLPAGREARVRSAEAHDEAAEVATGGRVALGLAGLGRREVARGDCVVRAADRWPVSEALDVELRWLAGAAGPLRSRRRLQAFLGTAEVPATCVLVEDREIVPGAAGLVQLRLERPVPAAAGDLLVLRSADRRTAGGARVIDPAPRRHGRSAPAARRLRTLERAEPRELALLRLEEAAGAGLVASGPELAALAAAGAVLLPGGVALHPAVAGPARAALLGAVGPGGLTLAAARGASGLGAGAAQALVDALVAEGALVREDTLLRAPGAHEADPVAAAVGAAVEEAGLRPPTLHDLAGATGVPERRVREALEALRHEGAVVRAGDGWLSPAAGAEAADRVRAALASGPLGIAELRDLWGVARKQALMLAAYLDAAGITRRVGDQRVLRGPRPPGGA